MAVVAYENRLRGQTLENLDTELADAFLPAPMSVANMVWDGTVNVTLPKEFSIGDRLSILMSLSDAAKAETDRVLALVPIE